MNLKEIILNKEKNINKDNNTKRKADTFRGNKKNENNINIIINERKKTVSKEKKGKKYFNSGLNNININNIKNIHYININRIKANIVMKTVDSENNNKILKKIEQFSKRRKDKSNSNSKNKLKNSQKIKNINIKKNKEGKDIFINLNYFKIKNNFSRAKKIKLEIKNNIKRNKTKIEDLNKDINISLNYNGGQSQNIFISENNKILNYNDKPKLHNKIRANKFYVRKLPTTGNFTNKNNNIKKQITKEKRKDNNYNYISLIKNTKNCPISHLLNNLKFSKIRQNKFIMISDSNSRSKTSSNSTTKSKKNSYKNKNQKNGFFIFNTSRNYKKDIKTKNKENKLNNLTLEKLMDLKNKNYTNTIFNKNIEFTLRQKKGKKLNQINYISTYINKKNNNIQRNYTTNIEYPKMKEKMNLSTKNDKSVSLASFFKNNEKIRKNELNLNKNMKIKLPKKNSNNKIIKKIKYSLNIKVKSKEKSKQNILENFSNTLNSINSIDANSRIINDISNIKINHKTRSNNNIKQKAINSNKSNSKNKKKLE